MPYKRKYGRYLVDPACEVPLRSKYFFKNAATAQSAASQNDSLVISELEESVGGVGLPQGSEACASSTTAGSYQTADGGSCSEQESSAELEETGNEVRQSEEETEDSSDFYGDSSSSEDDDSFSNEDLRNEDVRQPIPSDMVSSNLISCIRNNWFGCLIIGLRVRWPMSCARFSQCILVWPDEVVADYFLEMSKNFKKFT